MTTNRSAEELAMRDELDAWGRARWPDARVVHELVIGECRIDMAFIRPAHIVGIEIKSSKDTLDRIDKQWAVFRAHLPEVWLAIAPKWIDPLREQHFAGIWGVDKIVVDVERVPPLPKVAAMWGSSASWIDRAVTSQMLRMLWRDELAGIAERKRLDYGKRSTIGYLTPLIARRLTGDEIVEEVCRELRGRDAFWKADPPIWEASAGLKTRLVNGPFKTTIKAEALGPGDDPGGQLVEQST